jgi:hypothetical protein
LLIFSFVTLRTTEYGIGVEFAGYFCKGGFGAVEVVPSPKVHK